MSTVAFCQRKVLFGTELSKANTRADYLRNQKMLETTENTKLALA